MQGQRTRGTVIGRFTVEELIGAGGMGEVYAARDSQLGRRVALKILPAARATEPDRVERFVREARAASSLNHPAIVTIFDSGTATLEGGEIVHYLAMELLEGETLAQWTRGGRNREKVSAVLAQVADGLARAHAGGIVHRDLKPDNIMVTRGPFAKIVDFGIAKLTEREVAPPHLAANTAPTSLLGTTSFMSPEQVEGRAVDHRSDVFSFGSVIYAAFQGRSPFERESTVRTMNAIVSEPAPPLPQAPPGVARIARRCLAKDPEERYQSMKDVALDLRDEPAVATQTAVGTFPRFLIALVIAAALTTALWIGTHSVAGRTAAARSLETRQMSMMRLTNSGKIAAGAMSPDGKYVVYSTVDGDDQTMWVKQIATGTDVRIIPPSTGFYYDVKVSPDGNYVFYTFSTRHNPNVVDVYQIPILGGDARKVFSDVEPGIAVAPDGRRVAFCRFNAVDRIKTMVVGDVDAGSERVVLKKLYPEGFGQPAWSPDGQRLTFIFGSEVLKGRPNIVDLDLATGRLTRIPSPPWPGFGGISWVPDGSGIVLSAAELQQPAQLWYLPYNDGPAKKVTSDLASYGGVSFTSDSRSLVTHRTEDSSNVWTVDVGSGKARAVTTGLGNWYGTNGVVSLPGGEVLFTARRIGADRLESRIINVQSGKLRDLNVSGWRPALSPDQQKLAFFTAPDGPQEIRVCDVNGEHSRKVSRTPVGGTALTWMPDSRSVVYISSGEHQFAYAVNIDTGELTQITDQPTNSPAVSPDGKWLLCRLRSTEPNVPLWRTALVSIAKKKVDRYLDVPVIGSPHIFEWMPDGHSFAFHDTVGGLSNVWVKDLDGGAPRPLTHFDSGRILAYDIAQDGRSIVLSHAEPLNDLVLIRDFR